MSGVLDVLAMSVVSLLGALWAYRLAAKFDRSASIAERALSFQAFTRSQRRWQSRFGYSGPCRRRRPTGAKTVGDKE